MKLLVRLLAVSNIFFFGCGSDQISGEACDLGMGEYTEAICAQATEAAGCSSHQVSQKAETMCTGKVTVTRSCCAYNSCSSLPSLPTPRFPPCSH
jgi:hypothetical protein